LGLCSLERKRCEERNGSILECCLYILSELAPFYYYLLSFPCIHS
jgi:hypothetical protein